MTDSDFVGKSASLRDREAFVKAAREVGFNERPEVVNRALIEAFARARWRVSKSYATAHDQVRSPVAELKLHVQFIDMGQPSPPGLHEGAKYEQLVPGERLH